MSEATTNKTAGQGPYLQLALAAFVLAGIPELSASIGYGGSPVTTAAGMLALGVLAGIGEHGKSWQHLLAAAVLLPVAGMLIYIISAETAGVALALQIVLSLALFAAMVFAGSVAIRSLAKGSRAEAWHTWLRGNRDGLEAFLFGVIAAGMFPYLSILWPVGSLLASAAVAFRYPGRVWRHSIAVTVAFLGIAFLRIHSDIIVDVTSHELFPFELIVAFLLSAPFSFFAAAVVSRLVGGTTHS